MPETAPSRHLLSDFHHARLARCVGSCAKHHRRDGSTAWRASGPRDGDLHNRLTIRRDEVEARVLEALQDKLLNQELFEEFCVEFTREMNRLWMEHRAGLSAAQREIERIEIRRKIEMVMNGAAPSEVRDEMNANAARRDELKAKLAAADEPPPLLHPEMAGIYRAKVTAARRPPRRCAPSWTPLCSRQTGAVGCSRSS